jgi:hypothetical protein
VRFGAARSLRRENRSLSLAQNLLKRAAGESMKHYLTRALSASLLTFAASAYADCTAETVIDPRDGSAKVKTVCRNGGTAFTPGGTGGNCHVVIIPGQDSTLLCE